MNVRPYPISNLDEIYEMRKKILKLTREYYKKDSGLRLFETQKILLYCVDALECGYHNFAVHKWYETQEVQIYNLIRASVDSVREYIRQLNVNESTPNISNQIMRLYNDQRVYNVLTREKIDKRFDAIIESIKDYNLLEGRYNELGKNTKKLLEQNKEKHKVIESIVLFGSFFTFTSISFQAFQNVDEPAKIAALLLFIASINIIILCTFFIFSRDYLHEKYPPSFKIGYALALVLSITGILIFAFLN